MALRSQPAKALLWQASKRRLSQCATLPVDARLKRWSREASPLPSGRIERPVVGPSVDLFAMELAFGSRLVTHAPTNVLRLPKPVSKCERPLHVILMTLFLGCSSNPCMKLLKGRVHRPVSLLTEHRSRPPNYGRKDSHRDPRRTDACAHTACV